MGLDTHGLCIARAHIYIGVHLLEGIYIVALIDLILQVVPVHEASLTIPALCVHILLVESIIIVECVDDPETVIVVIYQVICLIVFAIALPHTVIGVGFRPDLLNEFLQAHAAVDSLVREDPIRSSFALGTVVWIVVVEQAWVPVY